MTWTTALFVLLGALFGAVGTATTNLPAILGAVAGTSAAATSVHFTAPDSPSVPAENVIPRGTSTGIGPTDVIWLVTQKVGDNSFQPQVLPCTVAADGDWTCPATFIGNKDTDRGQVFDLVLYRVDGRAVTAFLNYDRTRPEGTYRGLAQMPDGAQELGRIEVVRN
ncbi:hypothetical protein [Actinomycetospora soli]|uniref:hypothetical protein n=1 Tax=Actinomycetospora soli TaxID=2893887 RepID=UPI001E5FA5E4|nr:hypothetical protein [Actinomycetospora soli]MCD2187827.1 hypothetical protein [Actinomycetospora soli]